MSTTKYTLVPRGPVRGIGDNITITEKTEIDLNDFQALKVLLQGHSLLKGDSMDEVVKITDFVDHVDPQAILETVNLAPDTTAGVKSVNSSVVKVVGLPREYKPVSMEAEVKKPAEDKKEETPTTPPKKDEPSSTPSEPSKDTSKDSGLDVDAGSEE